MQVEGLKLAAAQDSMGEAAATMLAELKSETDKMKVSQSFASSYPIVHLNNN